MKKLNGIVTALALTLTLVTTYLKAQDVSPVAFLRMNPYQLNTNAATKLPYTCYFSVGMGNIGLGIRHPNIRYGDVFRIDAFGRPYSLDLVKLADALEDRNTVALNVHENVFTFGYKIGDGMLSVSHDVRMQASARFGRSIVDLMASGNSSILGQENAAHVDLGINGQAYNEYAVGYQMNINSDLSVGARAKLLFGVANVNTDVFDMTLYNDPDSYALHLSEEVRVRLSLPQMFVMSADGMETQGRFRFADLYRNAGVGFDLGLCYRINDRFSVAAAVNDLGFIKWSKNNTQLVGNVNDAGQFYDNGSFVFEGLDMDQLQLIVSDDSYREMFLDTLQDYFQLHIESTGSYTTALPASFLVRGSFDLNDSNRLSAQFMGCVGSGNFLPAMTLAYGGSFNGIVDVSATYTMMPGSFANIGLGLGFNLGAFHIYGATGNLLGLGLGGSKQTDLQMGIVFNLGSHTFKGRSNRQSY